MPPQAAPRTRFDAEQAETFRTRYRTLLQQADNECPPPGSRSLSAASRTPKTKQVQKPPGTLTRLPGRDLAFHDRPQRSFYQYSGGKRSPHDQSPPKNLRLLPLSAGRRNVLPYPQLSLYLPNAGYLFYYRAHLTFSTPALDICRILLNPINYIRRRILNSYNTSRQTAACASNCRIRSDSDRSARHLPWHKSIWEGLRDTVSSNEIISDYSEKPGGFTDSPR